MSKTRPFAMLDHGTASSEPFKSLPLAAKYALVCLMFQYNGHNNGRLLFTAARLKAFGFTSRDTITRCRNLLLACGVIIQCKPANRYTRKAAEYAVCWLPLDVQRQHSPDEFD